MAMVERNIGSLVFEKHWKHVIEPPSRLYCLEVKTSDGMMYKVGFTSNIVHRLQTYRASGIQQFDVVLIVPGTRHHETFLHQLLHDIVYGTQYIRSRVSARKLGMSLDTFRRKYRVRLSSNGGHKREWYPYDIKVRAGFWDAYEHIVASGFGDIDEYLLRLYHAKGLLVV